MCSSVAAEGSILSCRLEVEKYTAYRVVADIQEQTAVQARDLQVEQHIE
jgi:hypothetical protein